MQITIEIGKEVTYSYPSELLEYLSKEGISGLNKIQDSLDELGEKLFNLVMAMEEE
jgi:hypothetical protein